MPHAAAGDPSQGRARNAVLGGLMGNGGGGRRAFIDATGSPIALPPAIRRLVATDEQVGALLLELGAPVVGCTGSVDHIAALRPDLIVTGAIGRVHDLLDVRLVAALRKLAPVVAVDVGRPVVAAADLRALLGPLIGGPPATEPMSERRVGAPTGTRTRPGPGRS